MTKINSRYYDIVRDVRQNKGSILKASVDYIRKLKTDQIKKRQLEEKVKQAEANNRKLLLKLQVKKMRRNMRRNENTGTTGFYAGADVLHKS